MRGKPGAGAGKIGGTPAPATSAGANEELKTLFSPLYNYNDRMVTFQCRGTFFSKRCFSRQPHPPESPSHSPNIAVSAVTEMITWEPVLFFSGTHKNGQYPAHNADQDRTDHGP